jgi:prepilin-type N-terminal cleavage/methylation domain-containing protein
MELDRGAVRGDFSMVRSTQTLRRGFSLIELVIVIVIIGIIAAIAIPRMSRGAEGAAESSLRANLAVLRNAIDLYHSEHEGDYPAATTFEAQMTKFSSLAGATNDASSSVYLYGPYLREIPPLPVKVPSGVNPKANGVAAATAATVGWIYTESTGVIRANSSIVGSNGTAYNTW